MEWSRIDEDTSLSCVVDFDGKGQHELLNFFRICGLCEVEKALMVAHIASQWKHYIDAYGNASHSPGANRKYNIGITMSSQGYGQ